MNSADYTYSQTEQLELEKRATETISTDLGQITGQDAGLETEKVPQIEQIEIHQMPEMESLPQIPSDLTYSCLLIPRFSDHYLTGDVTHDLVKWMKDICISYGWRLDAVTIRPGYLQWVVTVPLTANPARLMQLTRQQTSQKIFEDYPRFKRQNLSPDFWAPGFSVIPGNHAHSTEGINNFILEIRKQQGII